MKNKTERISKAVSGNYIPKKVANEIWKAAHELNESSNFARGVAFMLDFMTQSDEEMQGLSFVKFYEKGHGDIPAPLREALSELLDRLESDGIDADVHVIKIEE